jgi:hypothetical protein
MRLGKTSVLDTYFNSQKLSPDEAYTYQAGSCKAQVASLCCLSRE